MQVKVYAKLNLTLHVGERVGEFHPIDSVATSVDVCDVVTVTKRADDEIRVSGVEGVEQNCNSAYKAARAFVEEFSAPGVDIFVKKGIPFGGGLGGSSADAAAVLFCLCKLQNVDMGSKKVQKICQKLGSDVTFMLRGGLGRLRGKGDDVEFATVHTPLYFALSTFPQQMSSREVYAAFDSLAVRSGNAKQPFEKDGNAELLRMLSEGANEQALAYLSNGLQAAAASISDYAEQYLTFTKRNGLRPTMTGSGSAYFLPFVSLADAQNAVDLLNSHGFSTILCRTVPHGIELN